MKSYKDATALRHALEARLKQESHRTGGDLARLRRRVIFERFAVRLAVDEKNKWIFKGGAVLEFRLADRARATKDIDLAIVQRIDNGLLIRELLIEVLSQDPDKDLFSFRVKEPVALPVDTGNRTAWRFSVEAWLAGKLFGIIRADLVSRGEELATTELVMLPGTLQFAGISPRSIVAVDRRQHFAEKLHALTRDYGGRPNTRVKDLVDLVLLIEDGLDPDESLFNVVRHVFAARDTHPYPATIGAPPPRWEIDYPEIALGLTETPNDLSAALKVVREFWAATLESTGESSVVGAGA